MAVILLTACRTTIQIPDAYNFSLRESKTTPYGCWTILSVNSGPNLPVQEKIAGELLCMKDDTIYVLVYDRMVRPIDFGSVIEAQLFTHKNQAGTYATLTTLFLAPALIGALISTDYAGEFLSLGIPGAIMGISRMIVEGGSNKYMLIYPHKNSLDNLNQFSRFPAGKPLAIDLNQLTLKPPGENNR